MFKNKQFPNLGILLVIERGKKIQRDQTFGLKLFLKWIS